MKKIFIFLLLAGFLGITNVFASDDVADIIRAGNEVIPEAVYYVTAYFEDGIKTVTVSSAAEAKIKKDEFLYKPGCIKVHIESKYPTIYRDCADNWYYN